MAKVEIISFSCRRVVPNRLVCSVNFSHNHYKKKSATTHMHTSEEHRSSRADHGRGGQIFPASSFLDDRALPLDRARRPALPPPRRQRPGPSPSRLSRVSVSPRTAGSGLIGSLLTGAWPASGSQADRSQASRMHSISDWLIDSL